MVKDNHSGPSFSYSQSVCLQHLTHHVRPAIKSTHSDWFQLKSADLPTYIWRMLSSGLWCCEVLYKFTNSGEDPVASILYQTTPNHVQKDIILHSYCHGNRKSHHRNFIGLCWFWLIWIIAGLGYKWTNDLLSLWQILIKLIIQ